MGTEGPGAEGQGPRQNDTSHFPSPAPGPRRQAPLSLYIHIPWCVRKCPYCDFNSHQQSGELPEAAYVDALLDDLRQDLEWVQGRELQSIFFGGGTPSLFSAASIGRILEGVNRHLSFANTIEITLEANPGTAEQQRFSDYRGTGVNRLSIGTQSFQPDLLQALGRIHSGTEAIDAVSMAHKAGFERINIDLMHGLPGQSEQQAIGDLQQAIDLGASHISWYQLTIEPNTEFYKRPPVLPAENLLDTIQRCGHELLEQQELRQYEVSAYAAAGQASRHNINYWQFGDYLGIGAGAHGKITSPATDQILRYHKTRKPEDYLARTGNRSAGQRDIPRDERALEFLMNTLRLNAGFERDLFESRTGLDWSVIAEPVSRLQGKGLLQLADKRVATTALGRRFLDSVLGEF